MFIGKFDVLGLNISVCDHDFISEEIRKSINNKKKFLIAPLASQTFVLAYQDIKIRTLLNKYNYLFSDSIWVKRAINFLYSLGSKGRIRGSNLVLRICDIAQKNKYRLFLYGTTQETLTALKLRLKTLYPKLQIVDALPSKFRQLSLFEKRKLIDRIDQSNTDILLIALGSPLQEIFAFELLYEKPLLHKPIAVIPVGAAFDFISGIKPQAPKWIQESGLEWLFRLFCEPKRLWKRYFIFGPHFIFLILIQKYSFLFNSKSSKNS